MSVVAGMHDVKSAEIRDHTSFCTVDFSDGANRFTLFIDGKSSQAARAMVEYFNDFIAPQAKAEPDPDFDEIEPF